MSTNVENLTYEQVEEIAVNLCKKNGYKLLDIKEYAHPDDYYLRVVLAHNEKTNEYATWILNLSIDGLALGHYFESRFCSKKESYQKALKDFNGRW